MQCCWNPCHIRAGAVMEEQMQVPTFLRGALLSFLTALPLCSASHSFRPWPLPQWNILNKHLCSWVYFFPKCSTARFPQGLLFNICFFFHILTTLGLTGLISVQSKEFSRVFSITTIQSHQFFSTSLLYGPTVISVHDYWKTIALTTQTFVSKVVSSF